MPSIKDPATSPNAFIKKVPRVDGLGTPIRLGNEYIPYRPLSKYTPQGPNNEYKADLIKCKATIEKGVVVDYYEESKVKKREAVDTRIDKRPSYGNLVRRGDEPGNKRFFSTRGACRKGVKLNKDKVKFVDKSYFKSIFTSNVKVFYWILASLSFVGFLAWFNRTLLLKDLISSSKVFEFNIVFRFFNKIDNSLVFSKKYWLNL